MAASLTAPQTLLEWQILAASLVALFTIVVLTGTRDPLHAISMGLFGGIGWTVVLAIVVFTWRGVRETVAQGSS